MKPQPDRDTKVPAKANSKARAALPENGVEPASSVLLKLAIELGPLLVFFGTNAAAGIYAGTAAFMAATVISLAVAWFSYHKVPIMPIVYTMFAILLVAGLLWKKPMLELLFGPVFTLTEEGWRKLTIRWAVFFAAMAVVNEIVWRNVSTDAWVTFKAFGFLPLTFLFAIAQVPLMQRHGIEPVREGDDTP
jgi:intracellular septation protein